MLKVNLLKNRGGTSITRVGTSATDVADFSAVQQTEVSSTEDKKAILIKIAMIVIWVAGLFVYHQIDMNSLTSELQVLRSQASDLQGDIQRNQVAANRAQQMQKDVQELKRRITIIQTLSKTRLREIKAIDYIQNHIPDKVWLSSMSFKQDHMNLSGISLTYDQLNQFVEALKSDQSYFQNVYLLKTIDQSGKMGTVKSFDISSELGKFD